jgi:hypothetical protein
MEVWLHALLTSVLDGGERLVSRAGCLYREETLNRSVGGPQIRSGRRRGKNLSPLLGIKLRFLDHPPCGLSALPDDLSAWLLLKIHVLRLRFGIRPSLPLTFISSMKYFYSDY